MLEKLKNDPLKVPRTTALIFLIYFIIVFLFKFTILPSVSITIGDVVLPAYQTTQVLFVLPVILIISYFLFIRIGIIKWQNLGFNKGKNGLLSTVSLGLFGGLIQGTYSYFLINYFILQEDVIENFVEKCIFAPIWEEFFFRVLFLTIIEFVVIGLSARYILENPKYKNQITEFSKKVDIFAFYLLVLFINSMVFVWWHNVVQSPIIFMAGMITGIVYLRTRSIIAPIIVHSMSNFVTGGFLFLVVYTFT